MQKASAETFNGLYACILSDDTYFYATKSEKSGLFVLPKTYYVKILSTADDFCKVEYLTDSALTQKVTGYCKTDELTFVEYIPNTPYFSYLFDLTYYIDPDEKDSPLLDKITVTCAYYGSYTIGTKTYCYVLRDDKFGYVPLPDDFVFLPNTEYEEYCQTQTDSSDSAVQEPSQTPSANPVQIAVIVLLCLLVPILAALILRQPKKSFYEWEER